MTNAQVMPGFNDFEQIIVCSKSLPVLIDSSFPLCRYMPRYMYHYETYPDYLSGVGYLMSVDNVPLLYKNALTSSYIHFEDVFITGKRPFRTFVGIILIILLKEE